jgi:hypothetical protein
MKTIEEKIRTNVDAARKSKGELCTAQGRPFIPSGFYCYCTETRGHTGDHIARAKSRKHPEGEIIGQWAQS